ncbi:hypothetical protein NLJ89_g8382 [Agrocybe chaxingu]|uniref:Uncharacterized protein n=1 Tax=Agrocybe chaxingu TaxID=84603 RepID=A0A9W8K1W4_9AGAR|nr:hypothetical protein NLJ89_g8382 [Agrocybe chaxingu]
MPTWFSSYERAETSRLGNSRDEGDTDDTPNISVVSEPDLPPAPGKAIDGWIPTPPAVTITDIPRRTLESRRRINSERGVLPF